ncbi:MAG: carbohydrate porin, partial [Betaproteobacteria bacterium]|nr:carbohydrate porin [Betaproteobacteria bacterium]
TLNIETIGLSVVPDAYKYYSRPEIRLYYTHASWNAAAALDPANTAYNGDNGLPGYSTTGAAGSTSGNSIGLQVEAWF